MNNWMNRKVLSTTYDTKMESSEIIIDQEIYMPSITRAV